MQHNNVKKAVFYRPRNHEASSFYKVVRDHFDEFECVYHDERILSVAKTVGIELVQINIDMSKTI